MGPAQGFIIIGLATLKAHVAPSVDRQKCRHFAQLLLTASSVAAPPQCGACCCSPLHEARPVDCPWACKPHFVDTPVKILLHAMRSRSSRSFGEASTYKRKPASGGVPALRQSDSLPERITLSSGGKCLRSTGSLLSAAAPLAALQWCGGRWKH